MNCTWAGQSRSGEPLRARGAEWHKQTRFMVELRREWHRRVCKLERMIDSSRRYPHRYSGVSDVGFISKGSQEVLSLWRVQMAKSVRNLDRRNLHDCILPWNTCV